MKDSTRIIERATVVEYVDGMTYVLPYSGNDSQHLNILSYMARDIMKHRDIFDLSNNYAENSIQLLKSVTYNNVTFKDVPPGTQRCSSDDGIGNNCSNCNQCTELKINC